MVNEYYQTGMRRAFPGTLFRSVTPRPLGVHLPGAQGQNQVRLILHNILIYLVGVTGFEPATPTSRT